MQGVRHSPVAWADPVSFVHLDPKPSDFVGVNNGCQIASTEVLAIPSLRSPRLVCCFLLVVGGVPGGLTGAPLLIKRIRVTAILGTVRSSRVLRYVREIHRSVTDDSRDGHTYGVLGGVNSAPCRIVGSVSSGLVRAYRNCGVGGLEHVAAGL